MEIAISIGLLILSFFFIVKGGDIFVVSATNLAKRTKIPQIIIGATIVSIATTLPELLIAIISSIDGTTGLAIGNSIGSVISNTCLICGISFLVMPSIVDRGGNLKYILYICLMSFIFVVSFFGVIEVWQAIILVVSAIVYFIFNILDIKKVKRKRGDPKNDDKIITQPLWLSIIMFLIGAAAVVGGSWLLVNKVTFLADVFGISEQFIGLTIVAFGTSLPELITTLVSIRKKVPYLGIGNIIGANILNISLILGVSRLSSFNYEMNISKSVMYVSIPFTLVVSMLFIIPLISTKKTYRWQGITLLSLYAGYLAFLIVDAFNPIF